MSKWKITIVAVSTSLLFCCTALAASTSFTHTNASNWDLPSKTTITSQKIEDKFITVESHMQWTEEQIKQFQSKNFDEQFFPALLYKADESDKLRAKVMFTNLPGAKFTRENIDSEGEEIKLSVLNTPRVVKNNSYIFSTTWLHMGQSDPSISLQSLQRYSQPNGTLNDLEETSDEISKIDWDESDRTSIKYQDLHLSDTFDSPFQPYTAGKAKQWVKSYSLIDSKASLDLFKAEAQRKLKFSPDDSKTVQFAITFKYPVIGIEKMTENYNLSISQIYAEGIRADKEEFTVSWFDLGFEVISLLGLQKSGFVRFGITELEGQATIGDLQRLSKNTNIDVIEIENRDHQWKWIPTGIHWLNKRFVNE